MNPLKIRYACFHDLNNYFAIKDLLGGLTLTEQARLRENIGIYTGDQSDLGTVSEVTYEAFNNTRLTNSLIPGKKYKILDYQTIYKSNVIVANKNQTWGLEINPSPICPIIVTAISPFQIDPKVILTQAGKETWEVLYNPVCTTLPDGIKTKGIITFLKDSNGNSAPFDFKSIKIRVQNSPLGQITDLYTFSDTSSGSLIDSSTLSNTKNNIIISSEPTNVFIGDTYNNIVYDSGNNVFEKGMHDTVLYWGTTNNIVQEPVRYASGAFSNKVVAKGNLILSSTISKTIHKVNSATIISYLDPITYAYQIEQL